MKSKSVFSCLVLPSIKILIATDRTAVGAAIQRRRQELLVRMLRLLQCCCALAVPDWKLTRVIWREIAVVNN